MKFKLFALIFNIVLFMIFFTIFLLPFSIPNVKFIITVCKPYLYFTPVFILFWIAINILYFKNIKIISYMESEDWTALTMFLEEEVFDKKKLSFKNVRVLSETLFLLDDFASLERLEIVLKKNKPQYALKLSPKFAAGKLIAGRYEDVKEYCGNIAMMPNNPSKWMEFYYAFACHMLKEYKAASEKFNSILQKENNPLIVCLCAYFLTDVLNRYVTQSESDSENIKKIFTEKVKSKYNASQWKKYTEIEEQQIHVMVFTKVINDASEHFFQNKQ